MEKNIKMYIHGYRDISNKCRTRYLMAESTEKDLTPTTSVEIGVNFWKEYQSEFLKHKYIYINVKENRERI